VTGAGQPLAAMLERAIDGGRSSVDYAILRRALLGAVSVERKGSDSDALRLEIERLNGRLASLQQALGAATKARGR